MSLLEMLPGSALDDSESHALAYTKQLADFFCLESGQSQRPDCAHFVLRKLAASASLSDRATALSHHVSNVVCLSADEQVRRTDADRVIALVTDTLVASERTILKHPCDSVRRDGRVFLEAKSQAEMAVSEAVPSRTQPRPTMSAPVNSAPETVCESGTRDRLGDKLCVTHVGLLGADVSGVGMGEQARADAAIIHTGGDLW